MGRDDFLTSTNTILYNFNPLSPHGERHVYIALIGYNLLFQSTLPAWGETTMFSATRNIPNYFNPLSPHGERLVEPDA